MTNKIETYYTFSDVFLIPQMTDCSTRSSLDTTTAIGDIDLELPIISANMDTITGPSMAIAMQQSGAIGALHRFSTAEGSVLDYESVTASSKDCFVSIGVNGDSIDRARALYNAGARNFIIDVAHGHCTMMRYTLRVMRNTFGSNVYIVAGNVATPEAVSDLASWGADCVKVGIGGGSCCSTRVITGHGVPMFSCLLKCCDAADKLDNVKIIADGGIRSSGDIIKAFVAGADYVMIGSLLAGTHETPGEEIYINGERYKSFRGMASTAAMIDRNNRDKVSMPVGEGINTTVPAKGYVGDVLHDLQSGIKSGMSYMNAHSIKEIPVVASWGAQTAAGSHEGTPHILLGEK